LRRAGIAHDAHRAVVVQNEGLVAPAGRSSVLQAAAQRGEQHHEAFALLAGDLQAGALEFAHALDHAAHAAGVGAARGHRPLGLAKHEQREPRTDHGEADDVDNGGEHRQGIRGRFGCRMG